MNKNKTFMEMIIADRFRLTNVVNIDEIEKYVEKASEKVEENEIKQWLKSVFKNYLIKQYPKRFDVTGFDEKKIKKPAWYDEEKHKGKLVKVAYLYDLDPEIEHIVDYFRENKFRDITRITYQEAKKKADEWVEHLNKNATTTEDYNGIKTIKTDGDYQWVEVFSEQALKREGALMDHCVGSRGYLKKIKSGVTKILSLRDKNNIPAITIEYDCANNVFRQAKCRFNKLIGDDENKEIFPYLERLVGVGGLFNPQKILDLKEKEYNQEKRIFVDFKNQEKEKRIFESTEKSVHIKTTHRWVDLKNCQNLIIDSPNFEKEDIEIKLDENIDFNNINIKLNRFTGAGGRKLIISSKKPVALSLSGDYYSLSLENVQYDGDIKAYYLRNTGGGMGSLINKTFFGLDLFGVSGLKEIQKINVINLAGDEGRVGETFYINDLKDLERIDGIVTTGIEIDNNDKLQRIRRIFCQRKTKILNDKIRKEIDKQIYDIDLEKKDYFCFLKVCIKNNKGLAGLDEIVVDDGNIIISNNQNLKEVKNLRAESIVLSDNPIEKINNIEAKNLVIKNTKLKEIRDLTADTLDISFNENLEKIENVRCKNIICMGADEKIIKRIENGNNQYDCLIYGDDKKIVFKNKKQTIEQQPILGMDDYLEEGLYNSEGAGHYFFTKTINQFSEGGGNYFFASIKKIIDYFIVVRDHKEIVLAPNERIKKLFNSPLVKIDNLVFYDKLIINYDNFNQKAFYFAVFFSYLNIPIKQEELEILATGACGEIKKEKPVLEKAIVNLIEKSRKDLKNNQYDRFDVSDKVNEERLKEIFNFEITINKNDYEGKTFFLKNRMNKEDTQEIKNIFILQLKEIFKDKNIPSGLGHIKGMLDKYQINQGHINKEIRTIKEESNLSDLYYFSEGVVRDFFKKIKNEGEYHTALYELGKGLKELVSKKENLDILMFSLKNNLNKNYNALGLSNEAFFIYDEKENKYLYQMNFISDVAKAMGHSVDCLPEWQGELYDKLNNHLTDILAIKIDENNHEHLNARA